MAWNICQSSLFFGPDACYGTFFFCRILSFRITKGRLREFGVLLSSTTACGWDSWVCCCLSPVMLKEQLPSVPLSLQDEWALTAWHNHTQTRQAPPENNRSASCDCTWLYEPLVWGEVEGGALKGAYSFFFLWIVLSLKKPTFERLNGLVFDLFAS